MNDQLHSTATATATPPADAAHDAADAVKARLRDKHGEAEAERIDRGVDQVLRYWRQEDGDATAFGDFAEAEFVPAGEDLDLTFARFEFALERLGGYMQSLARDLRRGATLDIGPMLPLDKRLAGYNPAAHLADDFFANKIAFSALLNFPLFNLEERLALGDEWSRRQWAEARLAEQFSSRVPAEVSLGISAAAATADTYINVYNLYLHHVLTEDGRRLFPQGLRLISHWGLRDELKARYIDPEGLEKQRLIKTAFDRIVRQEIPAAVIDNPDVDWKPGSNTVSAPDARDATELGRREADERYRHWLELFHAVRRADPYYADDPTFIARRFNRGRQIPEERVEQLFVDLLTSPLVKPVGELITRRLGRPLEPFDIWYVGFKPRGRYSEAELDAIVGERFPTVDAFAAELPRVLGDLGFSDERARFLADYTVVEAARGAGHASGASRRDDKAHLRTRVGADGLSFQGFNTAMHELGHIVEQIFSVTTIDHTLLQGVPNTAVTEGLAFVFQNRDLEVLGLEGPGDDAHHLHALETFWATCEIAGVALVDMEVWRWLYDHPDASPAELREAVVATAQDVWNRYFAEAFGVRDETLLAIYSHLVDSAMYIPDYPLGHIIAFQIESHFAGFGGSFGDEVERICQLGALTPDLWLRRAVGSPISAQPLLEAAGAALAVIA